MNRWTDRCMNVSMDGWLNGCICELVSIVLHTTRLSRSGFDGLDYRSSVVSTSGESRGRSSSSGHRTVTIAAEPRVPLSSSYLIELVSGLYYALLVIFHCLALSLYAYHEGISLPSIITLPYSFIQTISIAPFQFHYY